jgi:hypothetical protein
VQRRVVGPIRPEPETASAIAARRAARRSLLEYETKHEWYPGRQARRSAVSPTPRVGDRHPLDVTVRTTSMSLASSLGGSCMDNLQDVSTSCGSVARSSLGDPKIDTLGHV